METLISLAKGIHSKSQLSEIVREVWTHLSPLLPATTVLLILPGAERGDLLEVVGENAEGAFRQRIARDDAPDCPLWQTLEHQEFWLENAWSGDNCGFDFSLSSFVSVPLRAEELESGVLFFSAAKPFVWTEKHARLCGLAGEKIAIAARGVLSLMRQPEEFVEKMQLLRKNLGASSREEIPLRDGRIFERYSAPAMAAPAVLTPPLAGELKEPTDTENLIAAIETRDISKDYIARSSHADAVATARNVI